MTGEKSKNFYTLPDCPAADPSVRGRGGWLTGDSDRENLPRLPVQAISLIRRDLQQPQIGPNFADI